MFLIFFPLLPNSNSGSLGRSPMGNRAKGRNKVYRRIEILKGGAAVLRMLLILCTLLMLLAGTPGLAQSNAEPAKDQAALIDRLLKRIDEMEASQQRMQAKIDQLIGAQGAAVVPAAPAPVAQPAVAQPAGAHSRVQPAPAAPV